MKKLIFLLITAGLFSLDACDYPDPFLSKERVEQIIAGRAIKPVNDVVFVLSNDVYFLHHFDSIPKRVTNSPGVKKTNVKVSHDHSRIAYLNATGNPVIIDTVGAIQAQLSAFSNIKQMNWSADDKTLYMLVGNQLKFYGPAMNVPSLVFDPGENVISATITNDNTVLYIVETIIGINQYTQRLVKLTSGSPEKTIYKEFGETLDMQRVTLSKDGRYFGLTYNSKGSTDHGTRVTIYKLEDDFSEFYYEAEGIIDPIYDNLSGFIVGAVKSSWQEPYYISGIYAGTQANGANKARYEYKANAGTIYVDWK